MSPLNSPWQAKSNRAEVVRNVSSVSIVFTDPARPARIGQVQATIQIEPHSLAVPKFDVQPIPRKE